MAVVVVDEQRPDHEDVLMTLIRLLAAPYERRAMRMIVGT